MSEVEHVRLPMVCACGDKLHHADGWRAQFIERHPHIKQDNIVSACVYNTQWLSGGYLFNYTGIASDMWARVSGELSRYDEWEDGDPEDKDEWPVVLTVSAECDRVEDGFVRIAIWLEDLSAWREALHSDGAEQ